MCKDGYLEKWKKVIVDKLSTRVEIPKYGIGWNTRRQRKQKNTFAGAEMYKWGYLKKYKSWKRVKIAIPQMISSIN